MKHLGLWLGAAALALTYTSGPALADDSGYQVVGGGCNTANYPAGQVRPGTQTTGGVVCTSASAGASVTIGGAATAAQCAALCANLVVKASAGTLYSFHASADSTLSAGPWWIMIYNAASAPADGAVTPVECIAMPTGSTAYTGSFPVNGETFATGIVVGVSTTGCFTKTASTHGFLGAGYL